MVLFSIYALLVHEPRLVPEAVRNVLGKDFNLVLFAALIPLIFLIVRLFDTFAFDLAISRRRKISVPPLLRDVTSLVLYVILFGSAVGMVFGTSLTGLLTGGTVLAAILGLALQDTLGNLFSGIALHMEDTFHIGDVIRSGDYIGTVETVSWRATRIRTFNNDIAVLPNSIVSRERLEVFPRNNLNARVLPIGIDYHVPPSTVIQVLTQAAAHVDGVARERPCIARIGGFADSAVTYEIKYFMRDYAMRDRIDAEIRKAVWYAMSRNKIAIPFPIRSFQQYAPPEKKDELQLARDEILALFENVDLLSPLSAGAHAAIADASRVHFFSKGETIIRHGAAGDSMFIVASGRVAIRIPDASASGGHDVASLEAGAVFGEMALLTGEARTADVVALTDVTVIEIDKSALQPILADNPDLAAAISVRVAERRDHLEAVATTSAEEEQTTLLSRIRSYFGL